MQRFYFASPPLIDLDPESEVIDVKGVDVDSDEKAFLIKVIEI